MLLLFSFLTFLGFQSAPEASVIEPNKNTKAGPIVNLSTGEVEGVQLSDKVDGTNRNWKEFRGIRYGQPPVRFEKPLPAKNHVNLYDASEYRDVCVQRRTVGYPSPYYIGDEDCLFMNVLVPETDNTKLLPVLLWVHGGSYKHGNGSGDVWSETSRQYDGRFLALQEEVIVVNFNYRLNSFGFLSWKEDKGKSTWDVEYDEKKLKIEYQNFYGNLALYDAQLAFEFIYRNINKFGGDPDKITIAGASAGAGLTAVLSSIPSVADKIAGIIQQSGDAFGPTTGFMTDPELNLDVIAGYNGCDETSEKTMLDCLKGLSQYDLLKFSHMRSYGWVLDDDIIDKPYYDFLISSAKVPFLTGINDGDALQFAPEWIRTPNAGNLKVFREYTEKLTLDRGLALATTDALEFAYTYWNNPERDQDWWVRTGASYMSTDWRYGAGEQYKILRRQETYSKAVNYFYNFNHTNNYYKDYDLHQAPHIEERLYTFGAPFAMPEKFNDEERELSRTMMKNWGQFIREQKAQWDEFVVGEVASKTAYFDIDGLHKVDIEAHNIGSRVWLGPILSANKRNNCLSHVECPYPSTMTKITEDVTLT